MVRTDAPFELELFNQSNLERVALPGSAATLKVASVDPDVLIALSFHPTSNVTADVLRVD